jgi:glycosyltransferase involved in cell wall biosynthesis
VWKARQQLQQLLRREKFDLVICHSCWPQVVFGSAVRANNLPLVFWCHDLLNGEHALERLAKLVAPHLVIANSHYTQAYVRKLYQTNSNTLYLPVASANIGNHTYIRSAVKAELSTPDHAVVIVQASRLERWKGQSILLAALAQLRDTPGWICWIAGGVQRPSPRGRIFARIGGASTNTWH